MTKLCACNQAVRAGLAATLQGVGGDSRDAGRQQERALAEMARDYDRFFDILTLPTQSPMARASFSCFSLFGLHS